MRFGSFKQQFLTEELNDYQKERVAQWVATKPSDSHSFSDHLPWVNDRLEFPMILTGTDRPAAPREIQYHLERHGYQVHDYLNGHAHAIGDTRNPPRLESIGKILNRTNASKELIQKFNQDPVRQGARQSTHKIVISRRPEDIAGMSTNRGWGSCMKMPDGNGDTGGAFYNSLKADIHLGTHVAYLVHRDDNDIENPAARIALKPYFPTNEVGSSKIPNENSENLPPIIRPERPYGTATGSFADNVRAWSEKHFPAHAMVYKFGEKLYNDGAPTEIVNITDHHARTFAEHPDADIRYNISNITPPQYLHHFINDHEPAIRQIVAKRLPEDKLHLMLGDNDAGVWRYLKERLPLEHVKAVLSNPNVSTAIHHRAIERILRSGDNGTIEHFINQPNYGLHPARIDSADHVRNEISEALANYVNAGNSKMFDLLANHILSPEHINKFPRKAHNRIANLSTNLDHLQRYFNTDLAAEAIAQHSSAAFWSKLDNNLTDVTIPHDVSNQVKNLALGRHLTGTETPDHLDSDDYWEKRNKTFSMTGFTNYTDKVKAQKAAINNLEEFKVNMDHDDYNQILNSKDPSIRETLAHTLAGDIHRYPDRQEKLLPIFQHATRKYIDSIKPDDFDKKSILAGSRPDQMHPVDYFRHHWTTIKKDPQFEREMVHHAINHPNPAVQRGLAAVPYRDRGTELNRAYGVLAHHPDPDVRKELVHAVNDIGDLNDPNERINAVNVAHRYNEHFANDPDPTVRIKLLDNIEQYIHGSNFSTTHSGIVNHLMIDHDGEVAGRAHKLHAELRRISKEKLQASNDEWFGDYERMDKSTFNMKKHPELTRSIIKHAETEFPHYRASIGTVLSSYINVGEFNDVPETSQKEFGLHHIAVHPHSDHKRIEKRLKEQSVKRFGQQRPPDNIEQGQQSLSVDFNRKRDLNNLNYKRENQ